MLHSIGTVTRPCKPVKYTRAVFVSIKASKQLSARLMHLQCRSEAGDAVALVRLRLTDRLRGWGPESETPSPEEEIVRRRATQFLERTRRRLRGQSVSGGSLNPFWLFRRVGDAGLARDGRPLSPLSSSPAAVDRDLFSFLLQYAHLCRPFLPPLSLSSDAPLLSADEMASVGSRDDDDSISDPSRLRRLRRLMTRT